MDIWHYENELSADGYKVICGVDEAGRGPLAGPVYAAAVVLPLGVDIPGIGDSKKLSEKTRNLLFDEIIEKSLDYGVGVSDHHEIDEVNILRATFLAMNRAVDSLKVKPDIALIDGNRDPGVKCSSRCIIRGDSKSASIAAASILAKVSRDRYMLKMAEQYPEYAFEKHKGYGTKLHYERLNEHGFSKIHRMTFLKKLHDGGSRTKAQIRGDFGERLAIDFLRNNGYSFIARGFRSYYGEIDLIVRDEKYIVFVEVKLRKDAAFASAREHVCKSKQGKIISTANIWLDLNKTGLQPRFDVVEIYAPENNSVPEIIHIENAFW